MEVPVLLFAHAAELAGSDRVLVNVQEVNATASAAQIFECLSEAYPSLYPLLPSCRLAINGQFVTDDATVSASDEIALIPPVSGG